MKFSVKSLGSNISSIDFQNKKLIETLWKMGKIEQYFDSEFVKLKNSDKQIFLEFFNKAHSKLQKELNNVQLRTLSHQNAENQKIVLQIFRGVSSKSEEVN